MTIGAMTTVGEMIVVVIATVAAEAGIATAAETVIATAAAGIAETTGQEAVTCRGGQRANPLPRASVALGDPAGKTRSAHVRLCLLGPACSVSLVVGM